MSSAPLTLARESQQSELRGLQNKPCAAMQVSVQGRDCELAHAVRAELELREHALTDASADCLIYLPGSAKELAGLIHEGEFRRVVLRSRAFVYGADAKNPGMMSEERGSLLSASAAAQRWLQAESAAAQARSHSVLRLANLLAADESDLAVQRLLPPCSARLWGRDPSMQYVSIEDAARAIVAAAESEATGTFNISGEGSIPLASAMHAAGGLRLPLPKALSALFLPNDADLEELQYNWTVSTEKARRTLGFTAAESTPEALRRFIARLPNGLPELVMPEYDPWGLDVDYLSAWGWWFDFLRKYYWRIETEGMEHLPADGPAMFVSNHRGFMPLDGITQIFLQWRLHGRIPRFLINPVLLRQPWLSNFLTKIGGVVANQTNARELLARGNIVGILPEGIRGAFTPYKKAYAKGTHWRRTFAKIAIESQAPIVPAAMVGHAEIFPILGRIESAFTRKVLGWPYLPIAPMFPLAPVPLPSKWHVRMLEPIETTGLGPADAENDRIVRELSDHVQDVLQRNIDEMVHRRKHVFWGRLFDGNPQNAPKRLD